MVYAEKQLYTYAEVKIFDVLQKPVRWWHVDRLMSSNTSICSKPQTFAEQSIRKPRKTTRAGVVIWTL